LVADQPVPEEKIELNLGRLKEFYQDCWEGPVDEEGQAQKRKKNLNILQSAIPLPQLDPDLTELIQSEFAL
jgi:hypothetical protein